MTLTVLPGWKTAALNWWSIVSRPLGMSTEKRFCYEIRTGSARLAARFSLKPVENRYARQNDQAERCSEPVTKWPFPRYAVQSGLRT